MEYTTIKQSKKLFALGLNPDSADMYYFLDPTPAGSIYVPSLMHIRSRMPEYAKGDIPCWSVSGLMNLLNYPKLEKEKFDGEDMWFCECICKKIGKFKGPAERKQINAVYELVIYLLENEQL